MVALPRLINPPETKTRWKPIKNSSKNIPTQSLPQKQKPDVKNYTFKNPMGKGTIVIAKNFSLNKVNFGFPYHGYQRAELWLRNHPRWGTDVMLLVKRGQYDCDIINGCSLAVRFDEENIWWCEAQQPKSGSSNVLFLSRPVAFLSSLPAHKKLRIEAAFYQEGNRTFEFNIHGFDLFRLCLGEKNAQLVRELIIDKK